MVFVAKKLNTCRQLELAVNQAEPVPGPDPDKKIRIIFQKSESTDLIVQHIKSLIHQHMFKKRGVPNVTQLVGHSVVTTTLQLSPAMIKIEKEPSRETARVKSFIRP